MSRVEKIISIEITPDYFVNHATDTELHEVIMLAEKKLTTCGCTTDAAHSHCPHALHPRGCKREDDRFTKSYSPATIKLIDHRIAQIQEMIKKQQ